MGEVMFGGCLGHSDMKHSSDGGGKLPAKL